MAVALTMPPLTVRTWLEKNHEIEKEVWLIHYKKHSDRVGLIYNDAVNEAICFGWIDGKLKSIDKDKFILRYSPRKSKSVWSKINKDKVKILIEQGLMEEEGYKSIEIAKENGSWTILDGVEALIIPEDLKEEFANYKGSIEYFDSLSKSVKKILLHWVVSAKRKETRQKRILEIVENASNNLKPKQFR